MRLAIRPESLLLLRLLNIVLEVVNKTKKIIRNGKEETELSVFTNDMIVHIGIPNILIDKLLQFSEEVSFKKNR